MEQDLLTIHQRLLDGSPTAPRELVDTFAERLYRILKRSFSLLPDELVQDGAHDALLALIRNPGMYRKGRGTLANLLVEIGKKKLIDEVRRITRREKRVTTVGGDVELEQEEAKHPLERMEGGEPLPREVEMLLREILPDERDRAVWELVCDGRTPVEEFAAVLGLAHLPYLQMKVEVKRHRDRVVKKVTRRREDFRRYLL